jgi:hypothetical protein
MKDRTMEFKGLIIIDDPIRFVRQKYDLKEYFRRRKHRGKVIKRRLGFDETIQKRINGTWLAVN